MRRAASCLFLILSLLLGGRIAHASGDKPALSYFFENYCESCNPQAELAADFQALTGRSLEDYRCGFYNIRYAPARQALDEAAQAYGIADAFIHLPLLIADGEVLLLGGEPVPTGTESAPDPAFPGTETESRVTYLYVTACESCRKAVTVLDSLPDQLMIARDGRKVRSSVDIVRINIADDPALARSLFARYQVPEDRQIAPIVFVGDQYFSGAQDIAQHLPEALAAGAGLAQEPAHPPEARQDPLRLPGALLAGLVGGLNPCALSMLLLFLTLLLSSGRRLLPAAAAYLGAKFVTYLLIGTLFYSLFRLFSPPWLPLLVKVLATCLCAALIVLHLWDAWAVRKQAYGQIANQLPTGLRAFIQGRIRRVMTGKAGLISIILLGALVAASEFLCAGQVYLATLLSALHASIQTPGMLWLLLCYCAGFLLPSVALCLLARLGRNLLDLSELLRKHLAAVKVATALCFLVLLLLLWLS